MVVVVFLHMYKIPAYQPFEKLPFHFLDAVCHAIRPGVRVCLFVIVALECLLTSVVSRDVLHFISLVLSPVLCAPALMETVF